MFDLKVFTFVHVLISIAALMSGLALLSSLAAGRHRPRVDAIFLATAVITSVTGFGFPSARLLPSHIVGVLSLVSLAAAIGARYWRRLAGAARPAYAVGVAIAVYFLAFVAVAQAFLKVPALHALAPTQGSPAFAAAQTALLIVFVGLGFAAVRGLRLSAVARPQA